MQELKTKFIEYQKSIADSLTEDSQILDTHITEIENIFENYDITQEQKGTIISEILGKSIDSMYQLSVTSAIELIKEEKNQEKIDKDMEKIDKDMEKVDKDIEKIDKDMEKIDADIDNTEKDTASKERYIKGFDDQLLIKIVEQQAGLASYAVNANSTTAQDTIDDLKCKMNNVEVRVEQIIADNPPDSCPEESP